ncbi:MAG TPA: PaaI family thioesterase [Hyphomicrobiaceae bacterium]|nr:PaaI family thioesterase [Hyphomicrobiaceae bacterium]
MSPPDVNGVKVHTASLDEIKAYSGLEFIQRIVAGTVPPPPIAATLGFTVAEAALGFAVFTMTPDHRHYNPIGSVHGGVACTLLDSCMSCAVQTTVPRGFGYTTLELKVNLVRPITATTGLIRAEGRALHAGRRSGTAEGKIFDTKGNLLAHGTTTCMIFEI